MLAAVEAWPLAAAVRTSVWAYPALEVVHIAGLAALFGALLLLDLRVLGAARALPVDALARLAVPVALAGFAVAAATGLAMLAARATEIATQPPFLVKMGLILMAGANALWFHRRFSTRAPDALARVQVVASMLLWFATIAAGRCIAYS
ncbi:MAG: hypothetical protein ACK6C0_06325 [Betaproteobacteria bacterium]|jgi:hypothetical protein